MGGWLQSDGRPVPGVLPHKLHSRGRATPLCYGHSPNLTRSLAQSHPPALGPPAFDPPAFTHSLSSVQAAIAEAAAAADARAAARAQEDAAAAAAVRQLRPYPLDRVSPGSGGSQIYATVGYALLGTRTC